jgi:hypothetical protein
MQAMKKAAAGLSTVAAAVALGAAPAMAAVSGPQNIVIVDTGAPGVPGRAVLSGPVSGVGTSVDTEDAGTLFLDGGTISVSHPVTAANDTFNPATCVLTLDESGPYQFLGGTGSYAGISGRGTYTTRGTVIFARTPNGCSEQPIASVVLVRASGTTTLP